MLLIIAPIYIVRGDNEGDSLSTHTNTYAWFWTLAYMRGVVPSSLILASWAVTVAADAFAHVDLELITCLLSL